jgi:hypothetical protein
MPINSVALSNTFNEFRTTVNDVITTLNAVSGGSGVINANTLVGGTVTANNLTSGRVALSGTAGQIVDDPTFTYNTTTDVLTLAGTADATTSTDGTLIVSGGAGIAKKLYVGTDLRVNGTTTFAGNVVFLGTNTEISTTQLNINDSLLQLANNNVTDAVDIGVFGQYNQGSGNVHSGLFRDASDDTWKLFRNYNVEPSSTIDIANNGFAWANLSIGSLTAANSINIGTGQTYKINSVDILSATVLGSSVVTSSLTSVGTIGTGVWQGTLIGATYGGTGVNNGVKTITLGGNLVTSGAFNTTLTATANTTVTLPTSGTLVGSNDTGTVTSTMILDGTIVNDDISASAAVAYSKLALSNSIVNADIATSAAIANSKLANSAVTIGSTSVSLGSAVTTFAGLTSVTSTAFVGTLSTASQPNITSLGTLTALTVSGNTVHSSTGAIKIPSGSEAQKAGFTTVGMLRFNTDLDALEVYKSGGWASAGGSGATSSVRLFAAGIASGGQLF